MHSCSPPGKLTCRLILPSSSALHRAACSPSFGTKEGSCGYGAIPKDKYPYFSTAALAPSNKFYTADELQGCGQCFQIQCADDRAGE